MRRRKLSLFAAKAVGWAPGTQSGIGFTLIRAGLRYSTLRFFCRPPAVVDNTSASVEQD
jgi:hypothetical protein